MLQVGRVSLNKQTLFFCLGKCIRQIIKLLTSVYLTENRGKTLGRQTFDTDLSAEEEEFTKNTLKKKYFVCVHLSPLVYSPFFTHIPGIGEG